MDGGGRGILLSVHSGPQVVAYMCALNYLQISQRMSDRLIELVQSYPALYDTTCKDKHKKYAIWDTIAEQLNLEGGEVAKAKWRNLRDSYVKFLKTHNDPKRLMVKKYNRWPWADRMKFLNPYLNLEARLQPVTFSSAGSDAEMNESADGEPFESETQSRDVKNESFLNNTVVLKTEDVDNSSIGDSLAKPERPRKIGDFDSVDLLFLSYAQTLKSFSERSQVETKMEIALIMNKAEMRHVEEREKSSDTFI